MIRSMTGFGRAAFEVEGLSFEVEVRSVNHRYLDLRVRLPRALSALEGDVRGRVQARFARGKVDISITPPASAAPPARLQLDENAARAYLAAAESLRGEGVDGALDVATLLGLPGVARLTEPELGAAAMREALLAAVEEGIAGADAMRCSEGAALERELEERVGSVGERVERIAARGDEVQATTRERLRRRAEQLRSETGVLDEARLHQEIVLAADRLDVTEELVRLRSHVQQFGEIAAEAAQGNPVGRRLDFLLQEFGREANTIGSKASDAPVGHEIVELKAEIERIREQVQNVE